MKDTAYDTLYKLFWTRYPNSINEFELNDAFSMIHGYTLDPVVLRVLLHKIDPRSSGRVGELR